MDDSNGSFRLTGLSNKAYNHIQKEIVEGRIAPGTVVSEAAFAERLAISRTPVGKAIKRLAYEGLVEQVPRYGTVVRSIKRVEIIDLFEVREGLESFAASKAASHISEKQLTKLKLLVDAMGAVCKEIHDSGLEKVDKKKLQDFLAVDMAFHLLVIEASGNKRIQQIIKETKTISQSIIIRWGKHELGVNFEETFDFHRRIYEAIKDRSAEKARELMLDHIELTKNYFLNRFDRDSNPLSTELPEGLPSELLERLDEVDNS